MPSPLPPGPATAPQAMHRLTLRFADDALEAAFDLAHGEEAVGFARKLAWFVMAFSLLLMVAVRGLFPDNTELNTFLPQVMIATAAAVGALLIWSRSESFRREFQLIACIFSAATGAVLAVVGAAFGPQLAVSYGYALGLIHVANVYGLMRLQVPYAVTAGLGTAVLYGVLSAQMGMATLDLARHLVFLIIANFFGALVLYRMERYDRLEFLARQLLEAERRRSDDLLVNILPVPIAERLKTSGQPIADGFTGVSVLFADLVGFTPLSASRPASEVVALLDQVFSAFDALADRHGLEKIKTIGDAYMAAGGLPEPREDHAQAVAAMALDMLAVVERVRVEGGPDLALRVGLHAGPVVAGVIGRRKFIYDLWGDTVNIASRMESHGSPGRIQCTDEFRQALGDGYVLERRGEVEVKGKGLLETYWLLGLAAEGRATCSPG